MKANFLLLTDQSDANVPTDPNSKKKKVKGGKKPVTNKTKK